MGADKSPAVTRNYKLGTNMPRVGDYNLLVVFDLIRRSEGGMSRAEIAGRSALSPQTVSNAVNRLLEAGWVSEGERVYQPKRGKPRTLLHSNAGAAFAVGVHVEPSMVSAVLMDVGGRIRRRAQVDWTEDPEVVVASIARLVREVTRDVEITSVLGLGLSVPGPIDAEAGTFIDPPTLPGWDAVPFRQMVSEATGLTTYMQKDSIAGLSGELWNRDSGLDQTTLFVYAGFGIGFAAARQGDLYIGSSGNAGEAGHIKVDVESDICTCGRRGCVGKVIEFQYVVDQAVSLGILPDREETRSHVELVEAMDEIALAATRGDDRAVDLLKKSCAAIAQAVVLMADFLDATDVVIGGSNAARLSPQLAAAVESEFTEFSVISAIHSLKVHDADFGAWVGAAGAASLVFDAQMSPRATVLTGTDEMPLPAPVSA